MPPFITLPFSKKEQMLLATSLQVNASAACFRRLFATAVSQRRD